MELSVRIVETDGDVAEFLAETPAGEISVITAIHREGDDLILRGSISTDLALTPQGLVLYVNWPGFWAVNGVSDE